MRRPSGSNFQPNEPWTPVGYPGVFDNYLADDTSARRAENIVVSVAGVTAELTAHDARRGWTPSRVRA